MKIDVTQPIKEYDGRDVVDADKNPVPVRTAMLNGLAYHPSGPDPDNPGQQLHMTTESREQRFAISSKLWSKSKVDLSIKEKAFIIDWVNAAYPDNPLICGRVKQVLEGEGQSVPENEDSSAEASNDTTSPSKPSSPRLRHSG